ncbi:Bcr/CflA family efflux MFS transporter [Gulosibacter macacae]|nr:Bcr/CflA family efflux MFS transporter [Gulosibacter macacae]
MTTRTQAAPAGSATKIGGITLSGALIAPLVIVSAMPPLGTAAYLPALPQAEAEVGTYIGSIQLTLTAFIIGMALGQLALGPLSDRLGRRPLLLAGIIAFVAASAGLAFAPTLEVMIALRVVQGFAAASGMVLGRAIVSDVASGEQAAKTMSIIMAAGVVVPALAPLLGAGVLAFAQWRTIFLVLAGLGALVGVWVLLRVPETLPREARGAGRPARPAGNGAVQSSLPRFILFVLIVALSFLSMYAYVSAAPLVFQQVHGFSPTGYAVAGAVLSFVMGGVGFLGTRILGRSTRFGVITPMRAVTLGAGMLFVGAALVALAVMLGAAAGWLIAALAVAVAPIPILQGSASALAMDVSPFKAGASSAIIGATMSAFGAAAPPIVGMLGADARPMAAVMGGAAVLALVAALVAGRRASAPVDAAAR